MLMYNINIKSENIQKSPFDNCVYYDAVDEYLDLKFIKTFEKGFVPDEDTAIKIANIIIDKFYSPADTNEHRVLQADLHKDIWYVSGTLKKGYLGGVPQVKIKKSNGEILGIIHSR